MKTFICPCCGKEISESEYNAAVRRLGGSAKGYTSERKKANAKRASDIAKSIDRKAVAAARGTRLGRPPKKQV